VEEEGGVIYYRWGKARVGIIACPEHGAEILAALNQAQKERSS